MQNNSRPTDTEVKRLRLRFVRQ